MISSKKAYAAALIVSCAIGLSFCTKKDQVIIVTPAGETNILLSQKTATPPTIDGTVDAAWANATKLEVVPEVPNPGRGLFAGYIGIQYPATVRSMYDAQNIYFLVEWNDPTNNPVQPWYFNPTTKRWAQRANSNQFDVNGVLTKEGMGQDQLAMLWNIDHSTPKFAAQTCYASCHIFTPYKNFAGQWIANASGNHYTNGPNEKIDMWWCRLSKDILTNQMDDQYQDWAGGPSTTDTVGGAGNGRHADDLVPPSPFSTTYINTNPAACSGCNFPNGPFNNSQSLKLSGNGVAVNVPKWVIPDATGKFYYTSADTLAGGAAKKVTRVDSSGVIYFAGGTIDPNGNADYYDNAGTGTTIGSKAIPSFISEQYSAGRSDITAMGIHNGSGWVLEYKRALKTGDVLKQDIDFSSLEDQPFGMAIFNSSNYQHGIRPNLLLQFGK